MDSNRIKLVISDIDGTLITSNHEITDATKQAAAELHARGIQLCLASSRPPRSIRPIAAQLGLNTTFAAFNGALVIGGGGDVIAAGTIPSTVAKRIRHIAHSIGLDVWLYDDHEWWASINTPFTERETHTSGFAPVIEGYAKQLERDLNKLTVVGTPTVVATAEQQIMGKMANLVSASKSKPRFLDVTAYGLHKGSVVTRLARMFGITPAQVAVIGDGPNDVVMFEQAGVSIAMGQAVDAVRASAIHVTAANDEEGWAKGIEKFVLQKNK